MLMQLMFPESFCVYGGTMADRKSMSKKQRFEIFKRDGFTCQYCGRRPPEVVLVIDHINPVANGGDNDILNLITSCNDCNQGKGKTQLADLRPMPDASDESMALQQEIAELELYSRLKERRDAITDLIIIQLQEHWYKVMDSDYAPNNQTFRMWLANASPDLIEKAIDVTARNNTNRKFHFHLEAGAKYTSAVIRNMRDQGEQ
jgi:hypothetical protein